MSIKTLMSNDCCLLINIDLNSQRILQLFERRFKSNSTKTSFDFKSFPPVQPSIQAKVSRSLLRFQPKLQTTFDYEEHTSSESSSSEEEIDDDELSDEEDDAYLDKLAEWEPENRSSLIEFDNNSDDDDNNENENIFYSITKENSKDNDQNSETDFPSVQQTDTTQTEDLLVTFIHRPIKSEPIYQDNNLLNCPSQLDGQVDCSTTSSSIEVDQSNKEKDLNEIIAKIKANTTTPNRIIQLYKLPPTTRKIRPVDDTRIKPVNQTPKKASAPTNVLRVDQSKKERSIKPLKATKKVKPRLLVNLLKNNEDAIRPLKKPSVSSPGTTQASTSKSKAQSNKLDRVQDLSKLPNQQHRQKDRSLVHNKRKYDLPVKKSSEKPASVYMTIAEQKLNRYQQLKSSPSQHLKSSMITNSSVKRSHSREREKLPSKSVKVSRCSDLVNSKHNTKINVSHKREKEKRKKPKRLSSLQEGTSSNSQSKVESVSTKPVQCTNVEVPPLMSQHSAPAITTNKRPDNFFDECIVIDDDDDDDNNEHGKTNGTLNIINDNNTEDDDIQEIERQQYYISYDIRTREKLLDHAVHSPSMHMKWLFNLEYVLLEHIFMCHEKHINPTNKVYEHSIIIKSENSISPSSYHINPSFVSIIIINFIKMFILRNSSSDQQELAFMQFGLTSHLRYLLIELPTYNHNNEHEHDDDCHKCHQYSLIINILFDLLFDLMEYDLCEITSKTKYRSSLIEDDYFTRFLQSNVTKNQSFNRIKLIIYFIELIGIHMNKCRHRKQFQFSQNEDKLFRSMEDFVRHIVSHANNLANEKLALCFSVVELCILFVREKELRIKQMASFLVELCQDNPDCVDICLFDRNLLVEIRLVFINELIWNKFQMKLCSMKHVTEFFQRVQETLDPSNMNNGFALSLVRSLLTSYADLVTEIKSIPSMYSSFSQHLTILLRNQLELLCTKLIDISKSNAAYFEQIKRTLIFCHFLKCRWNKL